jgi:hypothetical protein
MQRRTLVTGLLTLPLILTACGNSDPTATPLAAPTTSTSSVDLSGIKTYLLDKIGNLKKATEALIVPSNAYYDLAKAANFDYAKLWSDHKDEVTKSLTEARTDWKQASPLYEQMEGIVAGTPELSQFDVILDAGTSAAEGGDSVVPFDLTLPDGRTLTKPGNLFGVTESTLYGTFADFTAKGVSPDFDGNGKQDFGDALPEANVLKAGVAALDGYVGQLQTAAQAWNPTTEQAFGALIGNVPTVSAFFDSWKNSRFVMGANATERDFAAISRLSDIADNVSSWQVIYSGLSPLVRSIDPESDTQIKKGLTDLKEYVSGVYQQEQNGKQFTPEEADQLGAEAQNRATAITGEITQVAAQLGIQVEE